MSSVYAQLAIRINCLLSRRTYEGVNFYLSFSFLLSAGKHRCSDVTGIVINFIIQELRKFHCQAIFGLCYFCIQFEVR